MKVADFPSAKAIYGGGVPRVKQAAGLWVAEERSGGYMISRTTAGGHHA
jgi:hypothetical protein